MCKIIEFSKYQNQNVEGNGFKNLKALFEVCESIESCNVYLETVEELFQKGKISENEMYTLRRIGRQKRIALANPIQKTKAAEKPGQYNFTPEMGETKPECQIEAQLSHYGKHYYLKTTLELKGRGIKKDNYDYEDNINRYTVTKLAYEKLQKLYTISYRCTLD